MMSAAVVLKASVTTALKVSSHGLIKHSLLIFFHQLMKVLGPEAQTTAEEVLCNEYCNNFLLLAC